MHLHFLNYSSIYILLISLNLLHNNCQAVKNRIEIDDEEVTVTTEFEDDETDVPIKSNNMPNPSAKNEEDFEMDELTDHKIEFETEQELEEEVDKLLKILETTKLSKDVVYDENIVITREIVREQLLKDWGIRTGKKRKLKDLKQKANINKINKEPGAPEISTKNYTESKKPEGETKQNQEQNIPQISYALDSSKLIDLVFFEKDLYHKLKRHYTKANQTYAKENLYHLRMYLEIYEQVINGTGVIGTLNETVKAAFLIVKNPILSFKMIRRFTEYLSDIISIFKKDPEINREILMELELFSRYIPFPIEQDLHYAIEGLLRLHTRYDLDLNELAKGNIMGVETEAKLSISDCLTVGKYAMKRKQYASAIDWFTVAMHAAHAVDFVEIDEINKIMILLDEAEKAHDQEWDSARTSKLGNNLFYYRVVNINKKPKPSKVRVLTKLRMKKAGRRAFESAWIESFDSCAGKNYQTAEEKSKLKCYLDTKSHPYFQINPLKTELLHVNPDVIQIYDFIQNETIKTVQSLQIPFKTTIFKEYDSQSDPYHHTTSVSKTWAYNYNTHLIKSFQKKMEFATMLKVKGASEDLVITGYSALGSHTDIDDTKLNDKSTKGNGYRMATFIVYLDDVDLGGATGFPMLGMAAKPVKGSAIFWHNSFRNGSEDLRTRHCQCPVALGQKLITNQWILSKENMFKRPCTLNKNE